MFHQKLNEVPIVRKHLKIGSKNFSNRELSYPLEVTKLINMKIKVKIFNFFLKLYKYSYI